MPTNWEDILVEIGGADAAAFSGEHTTCPNCGGKDRFRWEGGEEGRWYCNQCGGRQMKGGGGWGLALLSRLRQCTWQEALDLIKRGNNNPLPTRSKITIASSGASNKPYRKPDKPPANAPQPRSDPHTTGWWCYRDENGEQLFWIQRLELPGRRKLYLERTWSNADHDWHRPSRKAPFRQHWPKPKPLFNLHLLRDARWVVVAEGEKAAHATQAILNNLSWKGGAATTWCGGTNRWTYADLSPLLSKRIFLWPDLDEKGINAMQQVNAFLLGKGMKPEDVKILDPSRYCNNVKGWDAADLVTKVRPEIACNVLTQMLLTDSQPGPVKPLNGVI